MTPAHTQPQSSKIMNNAEESIVCLIERRFKCVRVLKCETSPLHSCELAVSSKTEGEH